MYSACQLRCVSESKSHISINMSTTISIFTPQTLSSAYGPFPGHGTHLAHHLHYQSITGTPLQSLTSFYPLSNKWSKPPPSLLCIITVSSVAQSCPTLCNPVDFSMPGLPVHHQLLKFAQTHVRWVSDAIQPSHPLSCPSPPAFNLSQHQGLFQWVTSCHQVAKYWSFSSSIRSSNEHPGLISFRMDWLDLLAVQGTLKHLLQHHSSEASILLLSAFFIAQLSHPYMTTGKTIPLTTWTFVGKGCLCFSICCLGWS